MADVKCTDVNKARDLAVIKSNELAETIYVIFCYKTNAYFVSNDGLIRNFERLIGTAYQGEWEEQNNG